MNPSKEEFFKLSAERKHSFTPVWYRIKNDLFTPVMAYLHFRKACKNAFILESVEQNEKLGRHSMVGFDPLYRFEYSKGIYRVFHQESLIEEEATSGPLKKIAAFIEKHQPSAETPIKGFDGCLVGYLSYNTISCFEKIPDKNTDDLSIPDIHFCLAKNLLIFDHLYQTLTLVNLAEGSGPDVYENACREIEERLKELETSQIRPGILPHQEFSPEELHRYSSNMTREEFCEAVQKAKQYINNGDVFQVVLSQRFAMDYPGDAFQIYRFLRSENPSPYHYHLSYQDYSLSGSSPEVLVKKEGKKLTLRPIAGTKKRGNSEEEDLRLAEEMKKDPKEVAEHMMLLDLGRNDLGRVCEFSSVTLDEKLVVERYSHVMHLVSNVSGKAIDHLDLHWLMRAVFPAGTLSGAPKVRAMEIIEELETMRRNTYAGSVIRADFHGNVDACITIRSVLNKNQKAYIQAGAGIVYDSIPEAEYQESLNKAKAVMRAVHLSASIS